MNDIFVARINGSLSVFSEIRIIDDKIWKIVKGDVFGGIEIGRIKITKQEAIGLLKQHGLEHGFFD